jgi:hypothetical protein
MLPRLLQLVRASGRAGRRSPNASQIKVCLGPQVDLAVAPSRLAPSSGSVAPFHGMPYAAALRSGKQRSLSLWCGTALPCSQICVFVAARKKGYLLKVASYKVWLTPADPMQLSIWRGFSSSWPQQGAAKVARKTAPAAAEAKPSSKPGKVARTTAPVAAEAKPSLKPGKVARTTAAVAAEAKPSLKSGKKGSSGR